MIIILVKYCEKLSFRDRANPRGTVWGIQMGTDFLIDIHTFYALPLLHKSITKSISLVSFSFDHIHPGWAALDGTMIIYRRLAKDHGVTNHMIIGDTGSYIPPSGLIIQKGSIYPGDDQLA